MIQGSLCIPGSNSTSDSVTSVPYWPNPAPNTAALPREFITSSPNASSLHDAYSLNGLFPQFIFQSCFPTTCDKTTSQNLVYEFFTFIRSFIMSSNRGISPCWNKSDTTATTNPSLNLLYRKHCNSHNNQSTYLRRLALQQH